MGIYKISNPKALTLLKSEKFFLNLFILSIPIMVDIGVYNIQPADIIFIILFFVWILRLLTRETILVIPPLTFEILLFIGLCSFSFITSKDQIETVIDIVKSAYLFIVYMTVYNLIVDIDDVFQINKMWCLSTILVGVIGIIGVFIFLITGKQNIIIQTDHPVFKGFPRIKSTLHSNEYFGSYMIASLPLIATLFAYYKGNIKRYAILLSFLFCLILGIFNLGLVLIGNLLTTWLCVYKMFNIFNNRMLKKTGWAIWVISFIILNISAVIYIRKIDINLNKSKDVKIYSDSYADQTVPIYELKTNLYISEMSYQMLKRVAWNAFLESPLLGNGMGAFHKITNSAYERGDIIKQFSNVDPHSTIFGYLSEAGIIGFSGLIYLWIVFFKKIRAILKVVVRAYGNINLLLAPIIGIIGLIVSSIHIDIMHFRFLWILVAMSMVFSKRALSQHSISIQRG